MRRLITATIAALAALALGGPAAAATGQPGGGATVQADGSVALVSDLSNTATTDDASWIAVGTNVLFENLRTLATEYNVTDDDCRGGSPRFALAVDGKHVFVYLGPSPSFTGCAPATWHDSGNLIGNNDACRWDTSQLQAGTQCNTYEGALALLRGKTVTAIQLVVDGGWAFEDREQTVLVRNLRIAGERLYGQLNAAQACKAQRAAMGDAAFRQHYGTNRNRSNAHGKCVSALAKAQRSGTAVQVQRTTLNAAQACKTERRTGTAAFAARYGTGAAAFSRCVTAKVKAANAQKAKGNAKGRP